MSNRSKAIALVVVGVLGVVGAFILQNALNGNYRDEGSWAAWVVGCGAYLTILTGIVVGSLPDRTADKT